MGNKKTTKKRKILLGTLIPLSIIGVALAVALPLTMCKKSDNGGGGDVPTPPEPPTPEPTPPKYLTINDTADWNQYFAGTDFSATTASSGGPWKGSAPSEKISAQLAFMQQTKYDGLDLTGIKDGIIGDYCFNPGSMPFNGRIMNIKADGIVTIGEHAFTGCSGLKSIEFNKNTPTTELSIDTNAFEGCVNVEHFGFGSAIKVINSYAFEGCKLNLADATNIVNKKILQTGVTKLIGTDYALLWNPTTKSATDGGCGCVASGNVLNATDVDGVYQTGFSGCAGIELTPIVGEQWLSPTDSAWTTYFNNTNSCVFKDGGDYALMKQTTYNGIDFGALTTIDSTFKGRASFNGRIINIKSDKIETILSSHFYGCGSLQKVSFTKCTKVENYSFKECANIQSIFLDSARGFTIGDSAFYGTKINLSNTKELVEHCKANSNEKFIGDDYAFIFSDRDKSVKADGCVAWGNIFKDAYWSTEYGIDVNAFSGCAGIDLWM